MQYVLSMLALEQGVPLDFKQQVTEKLLAISEFLHLVAKQPISKNRSGRKNMTNIHENMSDSNGSRDASMQHDGSDDDETSTDITELFSLVKSISDMGDFIRAEELASEIQSKLMIVPRKRKMIKACMSVLKIQKSRYLDAIIQTISIHEFGGRSQLA